MIKGNTIKFGYGTVLVQGDPLTREIIFSYTEPPKPVGEVASHNDVKIFGDPVSIKLDYESYVEFLKHLSLVKKREASKFMFRGYEFDFENYNPKSIRVCEDKANIAMEWLILAMAC